MGESANILVLFEQALFAPALRATAVLTRIDERLRQSPIREGYFARMAFHEAVASLWLSGELVHLEDLVLHDAHMDVRAPTHELTLAHQVLRATRQVASNTPDWALTGAGLQSLRGLKPVANLDGANSTLTRSELTKSEAVDDVLVGLGDTPAIVELDRQLAEMDAKLKRLDSVLEGNGGQGRGLPVASTLLNPLIYDEDDDAEARLEAWQTCLKATARSPSILRAAVALDYWNQHEVLPRMPWLGALLAASILRGENKQSGKASGLAHLPALNMGLRQIPRERRYAKDQMVRLIALIEAFGQSAIICLKEHDRLILAREQVLRKLKGKRTNSKLPQLIELVLSRPLVTATLIERELKVTLQGALNLVAELGLREVTGRGRYRAWAVA